MSLKVAIKKSHKSHGLHFVVDVDFIANKGVTVLFGPSGSGKTTVLDCVAGLMTPESGQIEFQHEVLFDSHRGLNLSVRSRRCGYVFQSDTLFPHMTVRENLDFGRWWKGSNEGLDSTVERYKVRTLLDKYPRQLSGGEKQRVSIARTLLATPSVLLLDEPFSGVDDATKFDLIQELASWVEAVEMPVLYVTHAIEEVFLLGERVIVLEEGKIAKQGNPREVLAEEKQRLVAALT